MGTSFFLLSNWTDKSRKQRDSPVPRSGGVDDPGDHPFRGAERVPSRRTHESAILAYANGLTPSLPAIPTDG
ncbi:MAG: hypothetical protein EA421_14430 [Gemmatimonadales bacterium]|nr:MAG: hypothetical protein EA421_14430 [Gemmatimonadales bacterium]